MAAPASGSRTVPAQLGFLAIYNPSLGGNSDEAIDEQILYYASVTPLAASPRRHRPPRARLPTEGVSRAERNERLRQIGLAQGMVGFSRGFTDGEAVDSIETETLRVTVHELEPNWWILASINLNKTPLPPQLVTRNGEPQQEKYEYSSREMKPAALILRDLQRAHRIFLLHNGVSLSSLFRRHPRHKFVAILGRYWDLYLSTWSVLLHGNPARDIYQGINMAASGELGIGVGEEERGSGERDVLEALVGRTPGLVDLIVSRFGHADVDATQDAQGKSKNKEKEKEKARASATMAATARNHVPWLGSGREPSADDGAIFLGTGALSRRSIRDITHWMEDVYTWGDNAYGVIEKSLFGPKKAARRDKMARKFQAPRENSPKGEVKDQQAQKPLDEGQQPKAETSEPGKGPIGDDSRQNQQSPTAAENARNVATEEEDGKLDKMVSYLKLGYGQYWTIPGVSGLTGPAAEQSSKKTGEVSAPKAGVQAAPKKIASKPRTPSSPAEATGHYLIGLQGEMEEPCSGEDSDGDDGGDSDVDQVPHTVLRVLNVELENETPQPAETADHTEVVNSGGGGGLEASKESPLTTERRPMLSRGGRCHEKGKEQEEEVEEEQGGDTTGRHERLRVLVYASRPFLFVLLFRPHTESLAHEPLYRSLHYQLSPLRRPLLTSTRYRHHPGPEGSGGDEDGAIYDLLWNPRDLTVHSTVPSIPDDEDVVGRHDETCHLTTPADNGNGNGGGLTASSSRRPWSRPDAVSTHLHVLAVFGGTRSSGRATADVERTQKTSRGWWIVWMRLAHRDPTEPTASASTQKQIDASSPRRSSTVSDADDDDDDRDSDKDNVAVSQVLAPLVATKEVFLIRQASDHHASWGGVGLVGGGGGGQGDTMGKLVQGIGVDTRRYVEDLLSIL